MLSCIYVVVKSGYSDGSNVLLTQKCLVGGHNRFQAQSVMFTTSLWLESSFYSSFTSFYLHLEIFEWAFSSRYSSLTDFIDKHLTFVRNSKLYYATIILSKITKFNPKIYYIQKKFFYYSNQRSISWGWFITSIFFYSIVIFLL